MADKKMNLVFNAQVEISQARTALTQLENQLEKTFANSGKGISSSLKKAIENAKNDLNTLEGFESKEINPKSAKEFSGVYNKLAKQLTEIRSSMKGISNDFSVDASKFFPKEILDTIDKAAKKIETFQGVLKKGPVSETYKSLSKDITAAENRLRDSKGKKTTMDSNLGLLRAQKKPDEDNLEAIKESVRIAKEGQKAAQEKLEAAKSQKLAEKDRKKIQADIAKTEESIKKTTEAKNKKQSFLDEKHSKGSHADLSKHEQILQNYIDKLTELKAKKDALIKQLDADDKKIDKYKKAEKDLKESDSKVEAAEKQQRAAEKKVKSYDDKINAAIASQKYQAKEVQDFTEQLEKLRQEKEKLETGFQNDAFSKLITELRELGLEIPDTINDLNRVEDIIDEIGDTAKSDLAAGLEAAEKSADDLSQSFDKIDQKNDSFGGTAKEIKRASDEAERLKSSIMEFFSVSNAIYMFKRAIHDAFETVKELDKAMTETAVVTDFSVGDMWEQLPLYTKTANELGTTTQGAYETMTLFYQQGLNTEQAFGVGTEAMKMARIAGLDYANATNLMTAALRGFNMEVNESSAQRINDVYSELAAITAADTEEIARAMTKTASIAHNAGMEFETTSAFLTQIIETTRESAETAGTAMKTVIARFQEMRKSPAEIGEIDGEVVDANKIEAALRSVGVALRDGITGQFRELDDVFLELAGKWDSLDTNTQRYIATIAAGSRQQSRFLAMMSDYERTMELVTAANESAGASQKQFEKTLDSLESKLNTLKNAWDEFTMGLANSKLIKDGVDLLTKIINGVNKLTTGTGGLVSTFLKLSAAIMTLRGAKGALRFLGSIIKDSTAGYNGKFARAKIGGIFGNLGAFMDVLSGKGVNAVKILQKIRFGIEGIFDSIKLFFVGGFRLIFSPVGAIIAAITAAIVAVTVAVKTFKKTSKEAQLKELNKEVADFSEKADEAKANLQSLEKQKTNLEGLQNTFEDLTVGTQAWKEALVKVNDEVLRLIETYPVLKQGLSTDENGMFQIDDSGWDKLLEQQQQAIVNFQNAASVKQLQASTLENKRKIDDTAIEEGMTSKFVNRTGDFLDGKTWNWISKISGNETWGDVFYGELYTAIFGNLMKYALGPDFAIAINGHDSISELVKEQGGWASGSYKGPLNRDALVDLMAILGEKGVKFSDEGGASREDAIAIHNAALSLGYVEEDAQAITNYIKELAGNGKDEGLDRMSQDSYSYKIAKEASERVIISNSIKNGPNAIGDKNEEAITNLLDITDDFSDIQAAISRNEENIAETGADLKEYYAAQTGNGYYSNGKLYTDGTMSKEMEISEEAMKTAIATAVTTMQMSQRGASFEKTMFGGKTDSQANLIRQLFSTEGTGITGDLISKYGPKDLQKVITEDLGVTEEAADALGTSIQDMAKLLQKNMEIAQERIYKQRKSLVTKMTKSAKQEEKDFNFQTVQLAALEKNFGEQFRGTLDSVYETLEASGDQGMVDAGSQAFLNIAKRDAVRGTTEDTDAVKEFIGKLDLKDPINSVDQLKKGLKSGNAAVTEFAQTLLNAGDKALAASAQIKYFVNSADFTNIQKEVKEIVKANGELSAADVLDLADGYKNLDKILEQTGATAGGVAELLEKLGDNELTVNQLTNAVMASLKGFDSLDSMVAETLKDIEDFDPGINENDIASFVNDAYEVLNENLEKGAFGNTQNFSYLDYLLGPGWKIGFEGKELEEQMKAIAKKLELNKDNMKASWEDLAAGTNFYGQDTAKAVLDQAGLTVEKVGEEIVFQGYSGKTTEELASILQEAYGVSNEYAKLMIADFKNYSTNLAVELNSNDFIAGMKSAYEVISSQNFVDESELKTIAELYGKTYEEVLGELNRLSSEERNKITITSFFDEDGLYKDSAAIIEELNRIKAEAGGKGNWFSGFSSDLNNINYSGALADLTKFNFDSQQQLDIMQTAIQQRLKDTADQISFQYQTSIGTMETITVGAGDTLSAKINEAEQRAASKIDAEVFKEVFKDISIKFVTDDENTGAILAEIKSLGDKAIPLTLAPNIDDTKKNIYKGIAFTKIPVKLTYDLPSFAKAPENAYGPQQVADTNEATGVKNASRSHVALVGEGTGPELIQTKNGVYLAGQNGPEFAQIEKGDTVYTAEETRGILKKHNHKMVPRFAEGYGGANSGKDSKGGGSGSGDKGTDWKNTFDMLYNLLRQINEEQRERNRIERRYEQELKKIGTSTSELVKISISELKQLDFEKQAQEALYERRGAEMDAYIAKNKKLRKYGDVSTNEYGERVVRINWEKIDAIKDQDLYKQVEEYVKQLEEWSDEMADVEDTINDIDDKIEEIKERGKDQYLSLENRIKDALIKQRQDEIDELSQINSTLTEGNAKIIGAMEDSISKMRQDRENEKTEKNLQEKYRKIAYLQQDTSGANDLDILSLQKELAEEEEDYTDTLIDQKISQLQEQNEKASEQRQQQIDILSTQLRHYEETGLVWKDVHSILERSLDAEDSIIHGSELETLLQSTENWAGMSETQKMDWLEELENQVAEGMAFIKLSNTDQKELLEGIKKVVDTPRGSGGSTHHTPNKGGSGGGGSAGGGGYNPQPSNPTPPKTIKGYKVKIMDKEFTGPNEAIAINRARQFMRGWYRENNPGWSAEDVNQAAENAIAYKKAIPYYKHGGLANFTGPAWLDGTKSKPEVILNARDSENFIMLRDILQSFRDGAKQTSQFSGDSNYDIDINVESISNDYDVDRLASKVEGLINQKARYRNNNTIGLMR